MTIRSAQNNRFPALVSRLNDGWLRRLERPRFGSDPAVSDQTTLPQAEVLARATQFHEALKSAEATPGALAEAVRKMLNGDTGLAAQIIKAINGFQAEINQQRNCETIFDPQTSLPTGLKVTAGAMEKTFVNRTQFFPSDKFSFEDFKTHPSVFGQKERVIVALTGWTKPPAYYLRQDAKLAEVMGKLPETEQQKFAEHYYVTMIKDYLGQVFKRLKENGCEADDIAFLYGVTPQGADRAVEEFCDANRIKYAGITCYDWVPYIPDEAKKRPIFLAKDPKEFGQIMSDSSDKVVVVGGRAFAATVTETGKVVGRGANPIVPIDLFEAQGIKIPGVVISDLDNSSSKVENAAAVLKGNRETNPAYWPELQGVSNPNNDSFEVLALTQILKRAVQKLHLIHEAQKEQP